MKKIILFLIFSALCTISHAQISKVVDRFIAAANEQDTLKQTTINYADSLQELRLQLNEMTLLAQLKDTKDELQMQQQRARIDSMRSVTHGAPLIVEGDTLFTIYAGIGGMSAHERASEAAIRITELGKRWRKGADTLHLLELDNLSEIMFGDKVLFTVTDNDAMWVNKERTQLALEEYGIIKQSIDSVDKNHGIKQLTKRVVYFILVIAAQYLLFLLTVYLYRRVKKRIIRLSLLQLHSLVVKDYEFLTRGQLAKIFIFIALIIRYIITAIQLIISIPLLFSIFPQTERLAITLFSYIYKPLRAIFHSVLDYIPNLFIIAIIYLCVRYSVKGLKYLAGEVDNGKLRITGFYPDWAHPTYNIIKFLLYAFMVAMIYPYLPGSDTGVFQGISVFVGLIVSLGSTAVIGNIIAGLVITYMRPFKIGDRIKLNETVGNVIEKTPFVTRIRTPKNEIITIPNSFILSSHTVNYSVSAHDYGLIIHTSVTIGYDAPWRTVHELLIDAAKSTPGVEQTPEPFVLETELSDFYPVYQINAYILDANQTAQIYSDLHQMIQDKFNAAGVEIMSPHYRAERDGNKSTVLPPESWGQSK